MAGLEAMPFQKQLPRFLQLAVYSVPNWDKSAACCVSGGERKLAAGCRQGWLNREDAACCVSTLCIQAAGSVSLSA
jgi:hypothetical protein